MGLTAEQIAANFAEVVPAMSEAEARAEANRCLYCYDAPCTRACPTRIDVPAFIKKIATGNLRGSARVILEANVMGGSCARACPVEELCEGFPEYSWILTIPAALALGAGIGIALTVARRVRR